MNSVVLSFLVVSVFFSAQAEAKKSKCKKEGTICQGEGNGGVGTPGGKCWVKSGPFGETESGTVSKNGKNCKYSIASPTRFDPDWTLNLAAAGDYELLAKNMLPDDISSDLGDLPLDSSTVDTELQLGGGFLMPLSDRFTLDFGLFVGSATLDLEFGARPGSAPLATAQTEADVIGGSTSVRFYPLDSERLRPWLSAGVRGMFLRPQSGALRVGEVNIPLDDSLETAGTADFTSGLGLDLRLNDRVDLVLSGSHGFGDIGWSAGAGIAVRLGSRRPPEDDTESPSFEDGLTILHADDEAVEASFKSDFATVHFLARIVGNQVQTQIVDVEQSLIAEFSLPHVDGSVDPEDLAMEVRASAARLGQRSELQDFLSQRRPETLWTYVRFAEELSAALPDTAPAALSTAARVPPTLLGLSYEFAVRANNVEVPSAIQWFTDPDCDGACGPGCDWCLCASPFGCPCYTNEFCGCHDSQCGAWGDFLSCDWQGFVECSGSADSTL